ncbi:lysosomal thioesterase PPT2-like isoform X1 [Alosa sapidissima]|uniref:lysosomal thioesterase PPT2-like isoform X1 n=1 Tax=Alosa sapidissima TaxID=34773 RepID=UPI001C091E67|nr:lysosomal thioesterase PPT2-like isoform X1 [Alosa sapidissima]
MTRAEMKSLVVILFVRLTLTLFTACSTEGYKPVIIVHGLFDGPKQFEILKRFITKSHPGTIVSVIDLYNHLFSLEPLWKQVEGFKNAVYPIMQSATDGIHLICFSQGGLVCRGLIATLDNHNVHSLILLSSPLAGQYGDTAYLKLFPKLLKSEIYHFCYTRWGQRVSICNYWNDPHQRDRYLKTGSFLAQLNGETAHQNSTRWRENVLRIKTLILIGGPDDGVITPWQSSLFGFYDKNENIVGMKDMDWYIKDVFGLKTLHSRGDLKEYIYSGVLHTKWHANYTVYNESIDEWLT